jgi:outer membrane protein assembly factor BamB
VSSSPAVVDGVIYYNSRSYLFAIDGLARNWPGEHSLRGWWLQFYAFRLAPQPPPISGKLWSVPLGWASSGTSPIIADGVAYTTNGGTVFAVDTETHARVWFTPTGATIRSSPALANDTIYIGSGDGNLYAMDAASGEVDWTYATGDSIMSSPLVSDGAVYFGSMDGYVYAIK